MWQGSERALFEYGLIICEDWVGRGYRDSVAGSLHALAHDHLIDLGCDDFDWPWWIGDADLHRSHRSNLLRKDPEWYGQYGWRIPDNLPYVWPVKNKTN